MKCSGERKHVDSVSVDSESPVHLSSFFAATTGFPAPRRAFRFVGLRPGLGGHVHICRRLGAWGRLRVCRIPPCGAAPPCRVGRERSTVPSRRSPRLSTEATSTGSAAVKPRSEEHTSELQSRGQLVCRLLLE